jgi:FkbM family methyltransferase
MQGGFIRAMRRLEKHFLPAVIIDVGANKGQSTQEYANAYPDAVIHAFEPATSTFQMLRERFSGNVHVRPHNLALDSREGEVKFMANPGSTGNRILEDKEESEKFDIVRSLTGDQFCTENGISAIDFLKIDTEGFDLRVLSGFSGMLHAKRIRYLQVECTTSPDNRFHVQLEKFIHFLHPFNYRMFGLYDLVRKIHKTNQKLNGVWYCNAVFVLEVENPKLRTDGFN